MRRLIAAAASALAASALAGVDFALTNDLSVMSFDSRGRVVSVAERETGRELLKKPTAFVSINVSGRGVAAVGLEVRDGTMSFRFADGKSRVAVRPEAFSGGFTFKICDCSVPDGSELQAGCMAPAVNKWIGHRANMASDEKSGLCVRPYGVAASMACTDSMMYAKIPGANAAGERFGVVAAPRAKLQSALQAMTLASGRPHSAAGGPWALGSDQARGSYMNANVTAKSLDGALAMVERGGFDVLHFRESWYACRGHYPVRTNNWPNGLSDMKAAVAKIHAAGYRAGLHTLTGCIDPKDPWVSGPENAQLFPQASYTLAADLPADAVEMTVVERPDDKHDVVFTYSGRGNAIRVGNEILQYSGISREPPYKFTGLTRGSFGTKPAAHSKGDAADYLHQRYIAFYPKPDSPLADKVADAIASVYAGCGFDMVYCDGTEGMGTPYGMATMRDKIISRCTADGRPCLNEDSASCPTQCWWYHSRVGAWDSCYWAPKRFHDLHVERIKSQHIRESDMLEIQMGWWAPQLFHRGMQFCAHTLDVMEYYASRNAGMDASMSIWSAWFSHKVVPFHISRMMTVLGWYERARRARAFVPEVQKSFDNLGAEFRLRQNAGSGEWEVSSVRPFEFRATERNGSCRFEAPAVPARTGLRVTSLFAGERPGEKNVVVLTEGVSAKDLKLATPDAGMTIAVEDARTEDGARAFRIRSSNRGKKSWGAWSRASAVFAEHRKLGKGRVLRFKVKGDGSGALLNVQIETPREYGQALSEHYVTLDFTGWRDFEMPMRERDADLYSDHEWPYKGYAPVFHRTVNPNHILALNFYLNDVPAGGKADVTVSDVSLVPERTLKTLRHEVVVNGAVVPVPFEMESGRFAELENGVWTLYSENADPLRRVKAAVEPRIVAGENEVSYRGETAEGVFPRALVEAFAVGAAVPAYKPMASLPPSAKRLLAYEAVDPQVYAPANGLDSLEPVVMRPGETAKIEAAVYGPSPAFELKVGGASASVPPVPGGDFLKLDVPGRYSGVCPVSISTKPSDGAVSIRVEFVKRYCAGE